MDVRNLMNCPGVPVILTIRLQSDGFGLFVLTALLERVR